MKIATYIIRFLLVLLFALHGLEKLFTQANPAKFADGGMNQSFIDFYMMLDTTGYLKFVGFFQLLCGILLVFKRTYLLSAVMLVPMILCLIATHIFMSHSVGYIVFDTSILAVNLFLIYPSMSELRSVFLKSQSNVI